MKKENLNNKFQNDFNILKDIFSVFKLTNKYYIKLCKKLNMKEIEFQALYLIYISKDKGVKMSLLGDELEIVKSGVTVLVDRLSLAGLVKRRPDLEDRRIMNVIITEKGNEIMNDVFRNNGIFKVSVLDFIQQDEKELLCNLIIKVKEKLESNI
ncbi:HTH-type transcriptional regulator MhqR [Clostridium puniceum]|uniref:HTH-type transcriptional regulator MhqR n=1 Tax=Clostridium puniceum TaxID=29367 RepID=A0A1S8TDB1_9CLOT|nr:MarR family winged helix-turn-helix transcriptional regulator [Clostridium puniceum]OOM75601.1 HTH-type transcriptional regulator MhqR [Clostridium puniceum]